jgi:hypothetical protein
MLINVKKWSKNNLTRFYLSDDKGINLGYVQTSHTGRGNESYYDRHRNAKGDNTVSSNTLHIEEQRVVDAVTFINMAKNRVADISKLDRAAGGSFIDSNKKGLQSRSPNPIFIND